MQANIISSVMIVSDIVLHSVYYITVHHLVSDHHLLGRLESSCRFLVSSSLTRLDQKENSSEKITCAHIPLNRKNLPKKCVDNFFLRIFETLRIYLILSGLKLGLLTLSCSLLIDPGMLDCHTPKKRHELPRQINKPAFNYVANYSLFFTIPSTVIQTAL